MKNHRFCDFDCRLDLTFHAFYLDRMWLFVAEIVKPDFTDGNNAPVGRNFLQLRRARASGLKEACG